MHFSPLLRIAICQMSMTLLSDFQTAMTTIEGNSCLRRCRRRSRRRHFIGLLN